MSGHSKWANIKRKKEVADTKKANIFSKLGKELTVAVKMGGSADPNVNRKLRDVIAKAKSQNMPNDNINRCIQKAAGDANADNYEEITYEGFGPCQVGGSLGQTGSVGYMFNKKGYILIEKTENIDEDSLMLEVLDIGAEDFVSEDEYIEIITSPEDFSKIREKVEELKLNIIEADIRQIATMKKELNDEEAERLHNFLDRLDDNDDVQNVWHNADI